MKICGVIVALIGGALFSWHIAKVLVGTDIGSTHQVMSLVGGLIILVALGFTSSVKNAALLVQNEEV